MKTFENLFLPQFILQLFGLVFKLTVASQFEVKLIENQNKDLKNSIGKYVKIKSTITEINNYKFMSLYQNQYQEALKITQKFLNIGHNTISKLFQLREEAYKCQFKNQQGKMKILKLIEELIAKMYLWKSDVLVGRHDHSASDLKELSDQCIIKLSQSFKEEQINNNKDQLFKLISEMNEDSENSINQNQVQTKQFILWRNKQIRGQLFLNQNATILVTNGEIYGFNNNHKLIKKFINDQGEFSLFVHLYHSKQFLLRFGKRMVLSNYYWEPQQSLEGHSDQIYSLLISKSEDLIISGSNDKTIKFWKKDNLFWTCQQTLITEFQILCLSLSQNQTKLIACGNTPFILLVEPKNHNQWVITQKLKVDIKGEYVSFIYNNSFIFHPHDTGLLQIFNYQNEQKQFIEDKLLLLSNRQGRQDSVHLFNNKTKVLTISYDLKIYVYQFKENGDYQLKNFIELEQGESLKSLHHDYQLIAICKRRQVGEIQTFIVQLRNKIQ